MAAVLTIALVMLAQAAAAAPTPAQTSSAAPAPKPQASESCGTPSSDGRVIVVCTQRPQGYRLNPDVMEAKREMKNPGQPVRPGGHLPPDCASVGPAPCMNAGINLIGAALTAAEMAKRVAAGQEIGSMFETDPQLNEYQRYQMAKARREAEETLKAAEAKAKEADAGRTPSDTRPAQKPPQ